MEIAEPGTPSSPAEGTVMLTWFPRQGVQINMKTSQPTHYPKAEITIPSLNAIMSGLVSNFGIKMGQGKGGYTASVIVNEAKFSSNDNLSYVLFHLTNFSAFQGWRIRYGNNAIGNGRLEMEASGWQLVLDEVKDAAEKVKASGGYGFTHTGKIQRSDGSTFSSNDVESVLMTLLYLFSFAQGRYCAPLLAVGFGVNEEQLWQDWRPWRQSAWKDNLAWFPETEPEVLSTIFPNLLNIVQEKTWFQQLQLAIDWYIQASEAGTLESKIVLAQVGLELLAWVEMIEKRATISKDSFDRLPTSDKLRLFFTWARIPIALPLEFADLKLLSENTIGKKKWDDGPETTVEFRNSIVHAKRRETVYSTALNVRYEVVKLTLWYLELSILYFLDYKGDYTCRIRKNLYTGQHEKVPWGA